MGNYTIEELDALAVIDPQIDAVCKSRKPLKLELDYTDNERAVQRIRDAAKTKRNLTVHHGVVYNQTAYHARDGHENRLLVFRPVDVAAEIRLPLVVHIHGGAGCVGSPEQESDFCQDLVLQLHCVVVAISYRLAPEWKFPVGRLDCTDAVKHISIHATEYGADLSAGFVIGGHSYGASASAVISLYVKEVGIEAQITGLYLSAGSYVGRAVPSEHEDYFRSRIDDRCTNSPVLDQRTAILFGESYAADRGSKWFKACNADSPNAFQGQPRTYFQVCGMDILRDDSLIYRDILVKSNVETKLDMYPGAPHLFWEEFGPGITQQGDRWLDDTRRGFAWLLRQSQ